LRSFHVRVFEFDHPIKRSCDPFDPSTLRRFDASINGGAPKGLSAPIEDACLEREALYKPILESGENQIFFDKIAKRSHNSWLKRALSKLIPILSVI